MMKTDTPPTRGGKKLSTPETALPDDAPFPIRSYGKGELAMCYIRNVAQQTAVNRFNEWIRAAPGLEQRLLDTGMRPNARRYTPAQVRLMVSVFGEP